MAFAENFTETGIVKKISLTGVFVSESLKIAITGVVKWLKLYVILSEVNVFVLAHSWLFICHLKLHYIYWCTS